MNPSRAHNERGLMPYFITMTKANVSIKKLRLTIEPRQHRMEYGKTVYPKRDIEEGGGLHVYFNDHGHFILPEALAPDGTSVYSGGKLDEKTGKKWVADLKGVFPWLTPEKAQKIYDWLTDPLPNSDGTEKSVADRKYPENESYAMTNGYQINLADPDGHWKRVGAIKMVQKATAVLSTKNLADVHKSHSDGLIAAESEAQARTPSIPEDNSPKISRRGRPRKVHA